MSERLRVALLAGGTSGEREVSLKGAQGVIKALSPKRYEVTLYDPAQDLSRLVADAKNIDVAFILLHGPLGEDGTVQGFLDLLEIPYQGSGVLGSALAMNKQVAKTLYRYSGILVPDWRLITHNDIIKNPAGLTRCLIEQLGLPLIIKPVSQGSSLGMSVIKRPEELLDGLEAALVFDQEVLVEEFISGREITGGVLGNADPIALPLVEIIPGDTYSFFDYEAKYRPGASKEICPAILSPHLTEKAKAYALTAHQTLHLRGYSRTDMMVREEEIFVLETNTIPGMTETSLLPQAAQAAGLPFSELLDRLIELALEPGRKD